MAPPWLCACCMAKDGKLDDVLRGGALRAPDKARGSNEKVVCHCFCDDESASIKRTVWYEVPVLVLYVEAG
jgi:hypothetical protein